MITVPIGIALGSLFVSGEVKYFEIAQLNEAKHWLASAR